MKFSLIRRKYHYALAVILTISSTLVFYQNQTAESVEEDSVLDYLLPLLAAHSELNKTSCQISISACSSNPRLVGTFTDSDPVANINQSSCLARASYYTNLCGNSADPTRITTAKYLSGSTVLSSSTVGKTCEVTLTSCPLNPSRVGTFNTTENGAALSADACKNQSISIYRSCGLNPSGGATVSTKYSSNGTTVSSQSFGQSLCVIEQNYCPNYPTEIGRFIDPSYAAHATSAACLTRASAYQTRCGSNISTTASYLTRGALTHMRSVSAPLNNKVVKNFTSARTNDQLWPAANALTGAVYSSQPFTSTYNNRDTYLELAFANSQGLVAINTLLLTPRKDTDGRNLYFPQSYEISIKAENGTSWITLPRPFAIQPDETGVARVNLGKVFNTRAVRIKPLAMASDRVYGGYYFQLSKVQAQYQKPHDYRLKTIYASEALWPANNLIDGVRESVYSSNSFTTEVNDRGAFIAAWFDSEMGNARVNTILLRPRMYRNAAFQFPRSYRISVASEDGSQWLTLPGVYTQQPDQSGTAIVGLGNTYMTSGISITPVTLGGSSTDGRFFQLAEITAAYLTPVAPAFELPAGQSVTLGNLTLIYEAGGNLVVYSKLGQPNQSVVWQSRTSFDCSSNCIAQFGTYNTNYILSKNGTPYAFGKLMDGDARPVQRGSISTQINQTIAFVTNSLSSTPTTRSPASTCAVPIETQNYIRGAVEYLNGAKAAPNVTQAAEQCLAVIQDAIASMDYLGWPCGRVADAYSTYAQECITAVQNGVNQAHTQAQAAEAARLAEKARQDAIAAEMARIKATSNDGSFGPFDLNAGEYIVAGPLALEFKTDGQLVLYELRSVGRAILWSSGTVKSCATGCRASFQSDGNLVLYQNNIRYFNTMTNGNTGAMLNIRPSSPFIGVLRADNWLIWAPGSVPDDIRTAISQLHNYSYDQAIYNSGYQNPAVTNCARNTVSTRCGMVIGKLIDSVRNAGWPYRESYQLFEHTRRCFETFKPENMDKVLRCQPL